MEGNVAATYTLIYRFLKQQSQNKAAEAVKKAAKPTVVLHDNIKQEGPPLEDIVKEWKAKQNTKSRVTFPSISQGHANIHTGETDSSSEDSESSDDSSSESEDSSGSDSSSEDTSGPESKDDDISDSDDSDETTKVKKPTKKAPDCDTSVTLSSAEENGRELALEILKVMSANDESEDAESDGSSDSDNSDADSSSTSDGPGVETSSDDSDSSSSSDSSDEEEAEAKAPPKTKAKSSSSSESSSDSEDESDSEPSLPKEDAHVAKRRKTSENGTAVTTALVTESQQIARAPHEKEKQAPKVHERFQRVKVQNMASEGLLDNGYEAKGGATNDYGQRAHRDLIVTRGAGFRKEKNKKKRGSYRGGEITMENHSIKFEY